MKNRIKRILSGLMYYSQLYRFFSINTQVIAYHTVNPEFFDQQMKYLKNNFEVVSLQEAIMDLSKKQVAITFDDGYKNNVEIAYPILKKYELPATIFVTTNFIDKNQWAWWDRLEYSGQKINLNELKKLGPLDIEKRVEGLTGFRLDSDKPSKYDFSSWSELKKVQDVFEIGAHTLNHPILTNITIEQARKEIVDSKKKIEMKLKCNVKSFAYPNGNWNDDVIDILKECGFSCSVLYEKGKNTKDVNMYKIYRRGINYLDNLHEFVCKINGVY